MLLLYHTSMSCKSPGDWNEFDYNTQVTPSGLPLRARGAGGSGGAFCGVLPDLPSTSGLKDGAGWVLRCLPVHPGNRRLVTVSVGACWRGHGQAGSRCGHCLAGTALPANHGCCSGAADPPAPPTQVELASVLKFVLDNEESLNENLETFLQRKGECQAPAACAVAPAPSHGPSPLRAEQALGTFSSKLAPVQHPG